MTTIGRSGPFDHLFSLMLKSSDEELMGEDFVHPPTIKIVFTIPSLDFSAQLECKRLPSNSFGPLIHSSVSVL